MNNLPSKSLSKSLLFVTPLFIIILVVLTASRELAYLFVLNFVSQVSGEADIMFSPTLRPTLQDPDLDLKLAMGQSGINIEDPNQASALLQRLPLVNMSLIQKWRSDEHRVGEGCGGAVGARVSAAAGAGRCIRPSPRRAPRPHPAFRPARADRPLCALPAAAGAPRRTPSAPRPAGWWRAATAGRRGHCSWATPFIAVAARPGGCSPRRWGGG